MIQTQLGLFQSQLEFHQLLQKKSYPCGIQVFIGQLLLSGIYCIMGLLLYKLYFTVLQIT